MRESLTLLFLIVSYNFFLWYITDTGLSPVPLFPEDVDHKVLVLSYSSVLYLSWVFGERERIVQWMGYLFFVQIVALSFYFRDLEIIVRDLPPVIFTFMLVALFESPAEKERRMIEREREELLKELDRVRAERIRTEIKLRELESELKKIEKEKDQREKINQLQKEIKEYREKVSRLIETNRKLFQLLDMLRTGGETGREEVTSLRRERKKLIRELIQLQELVEIYADENERLKEEAENLKSKVSELERKIAELEAEKDRALPQKETVKRILEDTFSLKFSERAVEELERLPPDKRRRFLRELSKLSIKGIKAEPLTVARDVYKVRVPGGRIYLRKKEGSWEVVGVLGSEDDKEKDRYIREVLSKIV